MKITYIGHSSFKIEIDSKIFVVDPYDPKVLGYDFPETKADILLLSHDRNLPQHRMRFMQRLQALMATGLYPAMICIPVPV